MDGATTILLIINLLLIAILGYLVYSKFNLLQSFLTNQQNENKAHLEQIITTLYSKNKQIMDSLKDEVIKNQESLRDDILNSFEKNSHDLSLVKEDMIIKISKNENLLNQITEKMNNHVQKNQQNLLAINDNVTKVYDFSRKEFIEAKDLLNKQNEKLKEISYDVEIN